MDTILRWVEEGTLDVRSEGLGAVLCNPLAFRGTKEREDLDLGEHSRHALTEWADLHDDRPPSAPM